MWELWLLSIAAVFMSVVFGGYGETEPEFPDLPVFVDLEDQTIYQVYWKNDCNYPFSIEDKMSKCLPLKDIPKYYNVVVVQFMKSYHKGEFPTFKVWYGTEMTTEEFPVQVVELNKRNTTVLISLGGPNSNISFKEGQADELKDELLKLTKTFGFGGVDIDLERQVVSEVVNAQVILAALKSIKSYFRRKKEDQYYMIIMSASVHFRCYHQYFDYMYFSDTVDYFVMKFYLMDRYDMSWIKYEIKVSTSDYLSYNKAEEMFEIYKWMDKCFSMSNKNLVHGLPVFGLKGTDVADLLQMQNDNHTPLRGIAVYSINEDQGTYKDGTSGFSFTESLIEDMYYIINGIESFTCPLS